MTRRLLVVVSLVALAWTAAPGLAGAAGDPAAAIVDVGWWTRQPGAEAQPGDGFEVALGIDGEPQSVAALRVRAQGGLTTAELTLTEAGGSMQEEASLRVCRTTAQWSEADPGAYDDAPEPSCGTWAELDREGTEWTGDVTSLLPRSGGTGSLMIVPVADPSAALPVGPGFAVEFSRARISATAAPSSRRTGVAVAPTPIAPPPATAPEAGSETDGEDAAPAVTDTGAESTGGSLDASGSDPGVDEASASDLGADPSAGASGRGSGKAKAAAGGSDVATLDTGDVELATGDVGGGGGGGTSRPWGRLVFLVPLSAAAGLAAVRLKKLAQERGLLVNGG